MGLFSKKKNEESNNNIPRTLPDTMMQRISMAQNSSKEIAPQKLYVGDIKSKLQEKYIHEKLPEDIAHQSKDKGPERHEIEQVLVLKDNRNHVSAQVQQEILASTSELKYGREKSHWPSFFVELERLIVGKKHHAKHVAAQDLISRMKEYHDATNKGNVFFMHEFEIEEQMAKSLSVLKDLEFDWIHTKKQVASAEKILFEKEKELETKLGDFKALLLAAERFKAYNLIASDGQVFFLNDGAKIYSVQQLIDEIPKMNDEVFFFHVSGERNDFASWIRDVFKLEELSSKVAEAKSKESLLEVLKGI